MLRQYNYETIYFGNQYSVIGNLPNTDYRILFFVAKLSCFNTNNTLFNGYTGNRNTL